MCNEKIYVHMEKRINERIYIHLIEYQIRCKHYNILLFVCVTGFVFVYKMCYTRYIFQRVSQLYGMTEVACFSILEVRAIAVL